MSKDLSISITPTGDFDTISGEENLRASLERRLFTIKGSLAFRPGYGVGVQRFVGAINSLATHRKIANEIAEQFPQDPRVEKVASVKISPDSSNSQMIHVHVEVVRVGGSVSKFTFAVGDMP